MRVIEVNMERRRSWGAGEAGDPREGTPTSGIVRRYSQLRKSGDPAGDRARFALVGGESVNRSATVAPIGWKNIHVTEDISSQVGPRQRLRKVPACPVSRADERMGRTADKLPPMCQAPMSRREHTSPSGNISQAWASLHQLWRSGRSKVLILRRTDCTLIRESSSVYSTFIPVVLPCSQFGEGYLCPCCRKAARGPRVFFECATGRAEVECLNYHINERRTPENVGPVNLRTFLDNYNKRHADSASSAQQEPVTKHYVNPQSVIVKERGQLLDQVQRRPTTGRASTLNARCSTLDTLEDGGGVPIPLDVEGSALSTMEVIVIPLRRVLTRAMVVV
ncbi:hypothetical protein PR048_005661 [Dryococelus australis]|uniref:Uncharacterized protein n=1 Tax=Dryococelus australis TaxID=614101 RepID=A0ABQ9IAY4_9NEOP|nr:hypothetical protein PR048_005661 [Dryococelus australis]